MIIVMIHWKIIPAHRDTFLDFWRTKAVVNDRTGMIGEFLSHAESKETLEYITWNLDDCADRYLSFVNVGIWQDEDAFKEQIGQYFNDENPIKPFEESRRARTVLRPQCWRLGSGELPRRDSEGVL